MCSALSLPVIAYYGLPFAEEIQRRADGTLKALGEKYFGQDISSED